MNDICLDYADFFGDGVVAGTTLVNPQPEAVRSNYALHTSDDESDISIVLSNRRHLLEQTGFGSLITLKQTHSTIVHIIDDSNAREFIDDPLIEGDGLTTALSDTLVGILTADCIPILMCDPASRVIGAAHAGWKGVYNEIAGYLIGSMTKFGADATHMKALIGPHIRSCCYEIGDDLAEKFAEKFGEQTLVHITGGKIHLDMETALRIQLTASGIPPKNIRSTGHCSFCSKDPLFYSYRRGDVTGRILTFIGMTHRGGSPE